MNLRRISSRATVAAASTALAASAVVGIAPAANAAEAQNSYTCSAGALYSGTIPVTVTGGFPAQVWAGMSVPAGTVGGQAVAQIPADAAGILNMTQPDGAVARDFAFSLGSASVPAPAEGTFSDDYRTWTGQASNAKFKTPNPGTYTVTLPESFTFTTVNDGQDSVALACELAEGQEAASLGEVEVLKQTATLAATAPKAKKGKPAKIKVTVTGDAGPATGKVTAVKGKKKASAKLNKKGVAVIKLGKLPVGKHKFTVKFAGNKSISGDSAKVTVKVTK